MQLFESGGGGTASTATSGDDDSTTFDVSRQTFSTRTFGSATGDEDDHETIEVVRSDDSTTSSSAAGGAGLTSAASRFTGISAGELAQGTREEQLTVTQAASDWLTQFNRDNPGAPATSIPDAVELIESNIRGPDGVLDQFLEALNGLPLPWDMEQERGGVPTGVLLVAVAVVVGLVYWEGGEMRWPS